MCMRLSAFFCTPVDPERSNLFHQGLLSSNGLAAWRRQHSKASSMQRTFEGRPQDACLRTARLRALHIGACARLVRASVLTRICIHPPTPAKAGVVVAGKPGQDADADEDGAAKCSSLGLNLISSQVRLHLHMRLRKAAVPN